MNNGIRIQVRSIDNEVAGHRVLIVSQTCAASKWVGCKHQAQPCQPPLAQQPTSVLHVQWLSPIDSAERAV